MNPENLFTDFSGQGYDATTPALYQGTTNQGGAGTAAKRRRKRYIDELENFNISKYDEDYYYYDDEFLDSDEDFDGKKDNNTKIREIFTALYMDIDNHFKLHQTSEYGNCWTISDRKFRVKKAGPTTETDEYLKGITTGYGIRVSIQQQNTYPFPADKGLFVPASMETDIGMKLVNITRLGGNYGKCDDGKDFKRFYNMSYTRRACQAFCQITTVIKNCSCFDDYWEEFAFIQDSTLKPCRSNQENKCLQGIEQLYYGGNLTCTCHNPCSEVSYVKAISQRQWPTNEYARVLLEWVCDRDTDTCEKLRSDHDDLWTVNNNFLKLNVYYEDLNFENVTETAEIEIQQFLSDVGGAIGLWIGLSILSLCELVQLAVELCHYCFHKSTKERRNGKSRREKAARIDRWSGGNSRNKESRWPPEFVANDRPNKDYRRSGYHSDDEGRNHRRSYDSRNHKDKPRGSHTDPRDSFSVSRDRY